MKTRREGRQLTAQSPSATLQVQEWLQQPVRWRRVRPLVVLCSAVLVLFTMVALIIVLRVPSRLGAFAQNELESVGFGVTTVKVTGARHLDPVTVQQALLSGERLHMFTDVRRLAQQVETLPWVAQARVQRRLPNHINVTIIERVPFAIWLQGREQKIIDAGGVVLGLRPAGTFANLPLVSGATAPAHVADIFADLATTPPLAKSIRGVAWISDRRWNVYFKTGEVLALPEGRERTRAAIKAFAELDAANHLLGHGRNQFDMRLAERMFVSSEDTTTPTHSPPPATEQHTRI